jgi:hypothetical protein
MDPSLSLVGIIVINLDVPIGPLILGGLNLIWECYPWWTFGIEGLSNHKKSVWNYYKICITLTTMHNKY